MKTLYITLQVELESKDESLDLKAAMENAEYEITFGSSDERKSIEVIGEPMVTDIT